MLRELWGKYHGKPKKQWKSWKTMEKPRAKGGLGFRTLGTIMEAFGMKETWSTLTSKSNWVAYMRNIYLMN